MALSVKNLTHALSEVRGVYECDSSSRRCLVYFRFLRFWVPLTVCPYAMIAKLEPKRVENEATGNENA